MLFACPPDALHMFSNNPNVPAGTQAFNDLERALSFASVESLVLSLLQRPSDLGKQFELWLRWFNPFDPDLPVKSSYFLYSRHMIPHDLVSSFFCGGSLSTSTGLFRGSSTRSSRPRIFWDAWRSKRQT